MKKLILLTLAFIVTGYTYSQDLTISPTIGSPSSGCYLSATETVTITVANVGAITHFGTVNVEYSIDGGAPINESFATPIPSGGTYIYSFTVDADLSGCQEYDFDFEVFPTTDSNPLNNTLSVTIASDCDPVVGAIDGPDTVCATINSGDLTLVGYTGNINTWEYSTDGVSWTDAVNSTDTESYLNIPVETYYWTIVDSPFGLCPSDTTDIDTIRVYPLSAGGALPANFDICDNGNGGTLDLTGYVGDVDFWEFSEDGGATWTTLPITSDSYVFSDLTETTIFQAFVSSGTCPGEYSSQVTLTLIPGSDAGAITGETLVCNFENGSALNVSGYTGSVTDWICSSDSGSTYISTGVSTDDYDFSGLLGYTIYGAIVQEGSCPPDTAFHAITVLPVAVSAGADVTITEGESTELVASGGNAYVWWPDTDLTDPASISTWASPIVDTEYCVEVTDVSGCKDTACVMVTVIPFVSELIIPNMITPNGDGFNDLWIINNIDVFPLNEMVIFNDYGQTIYSAQPYNNEWDGTFNGDKLPDGTYYYMLRLNDDTILEITEYQGVITIVGND
ncbi:MAG: gliding motility-associated C-terminal domain-containing protein [Crocinitomicaceae bacterium]|nr:gliding motility-associated C-terminal domain-containing protein [Crocinitomicaceae bacterium]